MSFLTPFYLWSLLAVIPLALVYLMKTRPRKRVTNALFLWKRVLNEKSSHFSLKKLRNFLSLLLMLLMFVLAGLSLTGPQWGDEEESSDLIVIIDSSVSMNASVGVGGDTRFEMAKERVADWLKSVEGGTRVALATVDEDIQYHCSLTSNAHTLKKSLDGIDASQVSLSNQAFTELSVLEASSADERHCRVIFLTDGAHGVEKLPDSVEVVSIPLGDDANFGITASDIAVLPGGQAKIFFTVSSSAKVETELEVEFTHVETGRIAKLITLTVPAESTLSEVIEVDAAEEGIWSLALDKEDIFSSDNRVMMGLNIPDPIGVSIDAERSYFYARCVEAFGAAENLLRLESDGEAGVVLSESVVKDSNRMNLVFAPVGESPYWGTIGEDLEQVIVTEVIKDHPLTKHLNLDNISFSGARELTAPEGALVILKDISGVPLLYVSQHNSQKAVVANFQPSHDNFYLSPWFPIMVHNGVRFLVGREEELAAVSQSGESITIATNEDRVQQVYYPLDGASAASAERGAEHRLEKLGGFTYKEGEQTWHTGAAVLSEDESGGGAEGDAGLGASAPSSGWPLAWWFLLVAIVIASAEEMLYHRRKIG